MLWISSMIITPCCSYCKRVRTAREHALFRCLRGLAGCSEPALYASYLIGQPWHIARVHLPPLLDGLRNKLSDHRFVPDKSRRSPEQHFHGNYPRNVGIHSDWPRWRFLRHSLGFHERTSVTIDRNEYVASESCESERGRKRNQRQPQHKEPQASNEPTDIGRLSRQCRPRSMR